MAKLAASLRGDVIDVEAVAQQRKEDTSLNGLEKLVDAPEENTDASFSSNSPVKDEHKLINEPTELMYVTNAGQVLLAPWLPRLFEAAGFLTNGEFTDSEAAEKAVHLLQYAIDGEVVAPEYSLVLNKVLCGVAPDAPLHRTTQIDDVAVELVEQLLQTLCANWPGLEGTTIEGLQSSFLQREGRLSLVGDTWQLLIEEGAFDMLLVRVPWRFRTIRLSWMNRLVHVNWR